MATTRRLGDVLTLQRGYDLPGPTRVPGTIPVISSSGRTGFHNEAKVRGPGVVIGRYGTLGDVYFVPEDFWPLNTALYVRDFKGNDPRFCAYLLKTVAVASTGTGAAVPGVNRNALHELPVRYHPPSVQHRIASILSAYDDLIKINERRIAILEDMARRIFREWFVDFRFPGHEGVPMVDTEAGRMPEGWASRVFGDIASLDKGVSYSGAGLDDAADPLVNLKNILPGGGFRRDGCKTACKSFQIPGVNSVQKFPPRIMRSSSI